MAISVMNLGRHWAYLAYVVRHKLFVAQAGWREHDTLWQLVLALLHDANKFHPAMWGPYARHFYKPDGSKNTTMGPDGFQIDPQATPEFDAAWLWHIKRSKHHPQYWVQVITVPCKHDVENVLLRDSGDAMCLICRERYILLLDGMADRIAPLFDPVSRSVEPYSCVAFTRPMPECYIKEMIFDWYGAGKAQGSRPIQEWWNTRGYRLPFHPDTRRRIQELLGVTA